MSDTPRRHTGLASCACVRCDLIHCGALDRSWDGWSWVWLAGEARVAMMRLTHQPPVLYVGPRCRWAGVLDWFSTLGQPLNFDAAEEDDDASA
jgi:hypothetical protein